MAFIDIVGDIFQYLLLVRLFTGPLLAISIEDELLILDNFINFLRIHRKPIHGEKILRLFLFLLALFGVFNQPDID